MQYTALSKRNHADLKLSKRTFSHLLDQPMVTLSVSEVFRAALDLPLAFSRKPDNTLILVAILSLEQGDNPLVLPNGSWGGGYMPAVVGGYPFALAYKESRAVVVVNEESDCLSTTEGDPLFDEEGNPTDLLNSITDLLHKRYPNPNRDNPVLEAIDWAGILVPWSEVSENLLKVDLQQLNGLDDQPFLQLKQHDALPALYAQLMSMSRINRIQNLAQRKKKMAERQSAPKKAPVSEPVLKFDDDIFNFDNI